MVYILYVCKYTLAVTSQVHIKNRTAKAAISSYFFERTIYLKQGMMFYLLYDTIQVGVGYV